MPIPPGPRESRYAHQWTFAGVRHEENAPHDSDNCVRCLTVKVLLASCEVSHWLAIITEYNGTAQQDKRFEDEDGSAAIHALDFAAEMVKLLDQIYTLYGRPDREKVLG